MLTLGELLRSCTEVRWKHGVKGTVLAALLPPHKLYLEDRRHRMLMLLALCGVLREARCRPFYPGLGEYNPTCGLSG